MQSSIRSYTPIAQEKPEKDELSATERSDSSIKRPHENSIPPELLMQQSWKNEVGRNLVFSPQVMTYSDRALDRLKFHSKGSSLAS